MSAVICTFPTSCCASFSAENTGRSGQPVQKPGGRGGTTLASACVGISYKSTASLMVWASCSSTLNGPGYQGGWLA